MGNPLYKTNSTPGRQNLADIEAFPLCLSSLAPGFVEQTNETVKTQLMKLVELFNLTWPKGLLLVLLNLKSTPFGKVGWSPFQIITGKLLRLDGAMNKPALLRRPSDLLWKTYVCISLVQGAVLTYIHFPLFLTIQWSQMLCPGRMQWWLVYESYIILNVNHSF